MRVALLAQHCPARDAIGRQTAAKLALFLDHGADVRLFVESDRNLHPGVGPRCQVVSPRWPAAEVWHYLTSADLVMAEYGHAYDLLTWLPLLAGSKARLVLDYHGVTPAELWNGPNQESLRDSARQRGVIWCTDAAIVHSRFAQTELLAATDFPSSQVQRLDYPVDPALWAPRDHSDTWRRRLGLESATVLLFVGRVAANKRLPVLVEALAHLQGRTPPVHAVVIGDAAEVFATEAEHCRLRAAELGVAERLHFLGSVEEDSLLEAYRSADLLVIPSRHEGYCLPVLEAMACGLPVLAARAAALPETVGDAGLTFRPDDAADLARQVRRILSSPGKAESGEPTADSRQPIADSQQHSFLCPSPLAPRPSPLAPRPSPLAMAIVSFRFGTDFVGGAETSLRTIAEVLHQAGHVVEVFTTCTRAESAWRNELPAGTTLANGLTVHRFPVDVHDRARHLESVRRILLGQGKVTAAVEAEYLRHSIHSAPLVAALRQRLPGLDAVIVGPYLLGLTQAVAQACGEKTLLLPCFHDEPLARLPAWLAYEQVGGILYHSPEEQDFAQAVLGINHPRAFQVGTFLDPGLGLGARPWPLAPGPLPPGERYLVYAGRFSQQKELPRLLDYARRYQGERPGRFRFVFLGQGEVAIPPEPWACNLGRVDEVRKRDVLAGAAALVQLSRQESLSLVALEAWAQGTPVLVSQDGAVLVGHLARSGGGRAVGNYQEFAGALDHLWDQPQSWQEMGRKGREYVRAQYGSRQDFTERLATAVGSLDLPLPDQMRRRGLERAGQRQQSAWRERFGRLVEQLLDGQPRPRLENVQLQLHHHSCTVAAGRKTHLLPVRLHNGGTVSLLSKGLGRTRLCCQVRAAGTQRLLGPVVDVPLPCLVRPRQTATLAVPLAVPQEPGNYEVLFWAERSIREGNGTTTFQPIPEPTSALLLVVAEDDSSAFSPGGPILEGVQEALVQAHRAQELPEDYVDVSTGPFASWKRRLKHKLLNNFKRAYVEVLARQQSEFNHHLLTAVQELAECCATLDHAVRQLEERLARLEEKPARKKGVSYLSILD